MKIHCGNEGCDAYYGVATVLRKLRYRTAGIISLLTHTCNSVALNIVASPTDPWASVIMPLHTIVYCALHTKVCN